jgi:hypothetical protein
MKLHRLFMVAFSVAFLAATIAVVAPSAPAFALTTKQKMETCKFGADDQKLDGAARKSFMSKCMANEKRPAKKPAAKPAAQPAAAPKT